MPLSTSNSSGRAKHFFSKWRWSYIWLFIVVIYILSIAGWELHWRFRGFTPSVTDDWPVWSQIRRQANHHNNSLALVGASRILLGLDPAIIEKETDYTAHMLAIDGSNPIPILVELSNDSDFVGSVICSIPSLWLAGDLKSKGDRTAKWLRKFKKQSLSSKLETRLILTFQGLLVFRYGGVTPKKLWEKWQQDRPVKPPYAPMRIDRFRTADYSMIDLESLRDARIERTRDLHLKATMLGQVEFQQRVEIIQQAVERIQQRGGKVVFVRFPSCGEVFSIEEETVPRHRYWNVLAKEVSAPTIHFTDYENLQDFSCTDGSHLDYSDARRFTREIIMILQHQNFF